VKEEGNGEGLLKTRLTVLHMAVFGLGLCLGLGLYYGFEAKTQFQIESQDITRCNNWWLKQMDQIENQINQRCQCR
jgi:hypothetical protein